MKSSINQKLIFLSSSLISILIIVIGLSFYTIDLLKGKDGINKSMYYLTESYKSFMIFAEDKNIINKEYFEFSFQKLNEEIKQNGFLNENELSKLLLKYDSLFHSYYRLSKIRGLNENLGLEGKFRKSAHNLEYILSNKDLKKVQVDLLQIRRREKDYLMRKNPVYIEMISENIKNIKNVIKGSNLDSDLKDTIYLYLDNYKIDFSQIVSILDSLDLVSDNFKRTQNETYSNIEAAYIDINQYADRFINFIIIFFILSIILVTYLARKLSQSIRKPIIKLSKIVNEINSDNFSLRAKIFTNDEIGELALAFNKMLDKLENAYHQIEYANYNLENQVEKRTEELLKEIDERKIYEEKLHNALEKINNIKEELYISLSKEKELNLLKSRFVSMISHEYRTPLTVIMTSTYLLEKYFELGDFDNFKKKLGNIQSAIDSMKVLLEDTLTLDRFESGKINVNKIKTNLKEILILSKHEAELLLKPQQNIELNIQNENLYLDTDPTLLKHIISNLISNAIKYSPNGSPIKIDLIEDKSDIYLNIIDFGIGIPEENQKNLFSPFYRADNVDTIQGTGLGLSIVKKFVDLINAEIDFESKINLGTKFTLKFKRAV